MRFALVALLACTPAVQAPKPAEPPLPLWPEVRAGTLANGLTYYVLPHAAPAHRAYVWLVVKAGSVDEDDDQRGIAHLVEHIAFEGTKRFANRAIDGYFESIGMQSNADVNARTDFDHTTFMLTVPTDKSEYVNTALAIVRDWAGDVTFDQGGLDRERKIVNEEWRRGLGAERRIADKQLAITLAGSRYATRDPIGQPDIVAHAQPETIVRFYKTWYRADRMAVIVVGDVDPVAVESRVKDELGTLPKPSSPMPTTPAPARAKDTRISIETDADAVAPTVRIAYVAPRHPLASRADLRRRLTERLYAIILGWRLQNQASRATTAYLSARVEFESPAESFDTFVVSAVAKAGRIEDTLYALVVEQRRIDKFVVTPGELDAAKKQLARDHENAALAGRTRDGRNLVQELARHFTLGELVLGPGAERDLVAALLPTITEVDVAKIVDDYVDGGNRAVLIAGAADMPNGDAVTKTIDNAERARVYAWKGPPDPKPLLDKPPTPGTITAEKSLATIDAVEWTLSNGARVVVKHTDFSAGSFELAGISPGGLAMVDDADLPEATFATDVASLGGLGTRTTFEVNNALIGKTAHATASLGDDSESIAAGGDARDVEAVLQLVYLRMATPRYDAKAAAVWKANLVERIDNTRRRPEVAFELEAIAALFQDSPRAKPFSHERHSALDTDKAFAIYKQRFGDATDFTFVIVGDVDPKTLRPLVERYLASLPAMGRIDAPKDRRPATAPGVIAKAWTHGHDPKARVRLDFHGDLAWSRDAATDLAIAHLAIDERLRGVLREDKGGVYNVGVSTHLVHTGHRQLTIRFDCDPARVDELIKATLDELVALSKHVPDDLVASLAASNMRKRETQLRDNGFWTSELAQAYRYGDDPNQVASDASARITADLVRAAIATFADPKQHTQFELLPEP